MKKNLLIIILINISINQFSQSFEGSWININARRIDNSKIVKPFAYKGYFKYIIEGNKLFSVDTPYHDMVKKLAFDITFSSKTEATTSNLNLYLQSDSILILTEKHTEDQIDKKNRYILLKEKYYFEFLRNKKEIKFENDTLILSNDYIFPYYWTDYMYSLTHNFYDNLRTKKGSISGHFIINRNKEIVNIEFQTNNGFEEVDKLKRLIKKSEKNWELPFPEYSYIVPFTFAFVKEGEALDVSFRKDDFDRFKEKENISTIDPIIWNKKDNAFNKGTKYAQKQKYNLAIEEFNFCISVDPLDIDSYYNRAFCYYSLNMVKEACLDWEYLMKLEQSTATKIFQENCNK